MTIVEFINARLDEDEAVAREAVLIRDQTKFRPGHEPEVPDSAVWANDDVLGGAVVSVGPERVLAEVEAKRKVVERHEFALSARVDDRPGVAEVLTGVVRLLALPYADHELYDEAWRP